MDFLEERILRDGTVRSGGVLKVDGFLNHLVDVGLVNRIGAEFKKRFAGLEMVANCESSYRNLIIVSLSLSVGLGFTQSAGMFNIFPQIIRDIFAENCVATVFILAVSLNLILPKDS